MVTATTAFGWLEKIAEYTSYLFNDRSKVHEISIKIAPEEMHNINKAITLNIIKSGIVQIGKPHDTYKYSALLLPYGGGVKIKFIPNGEETTS